MDIYLITRTTHIWQDTPSHHSWSWSWHPPLSPKLSRTYCTPADANDPTTTLSIPRRMIHLAVVQLSNRDWNPLDRTAANQRRPRHPLVMSAPHCWPITSRHRTTEPMKWVSDPDETNEDDETIETTLLHNHKCRNLKTVITWKVLKRTFRREIFY